MYMYALKRCCNQHHSSLSSYTHHNYSSDTATITLYLAVYTVLTFKVYWRAECLGLTITQNSSKKLLNLYVLKIRGPVQSTKGIHAGQR